MTTRYDVLAVDIRTKRVEVLAQNKDERNAEAVVMMTVIRRGADGVYYPIVDAGLYQDGDTFPKEPPVP